MTVNTIVSSEFSDIAIPAAPLFTLHCKETFGTRYGMYVDYCSSLVVTDNETGNRGIITPCTLDEYMSIEV